PILNQISEIISYQIYPNDSKYTPQDVYSLDVEIIFRDKVAFDVFMKQPKHYEANAIFDKYLANPPYMVLTHEV
ncbi:hypothetical protein AB751O23_BI_00080, partial [Chlamydiales bacterium SCGC AB-751-O23]